MSTIETKYATIDRDELKRLQRDSERLDFLDALKLRGSSTDVHFYRVSVRLYARTGVGARTEFEGPGESVREALDAAMAIVMSGAQGESHE